jgi:hypothetical protein
MLVVVSTGNGASDNGSRATLRQGQTRTDLESDSILEKRFERDTKEQGDADKR